MLSILDHLCIPDFFEDLFTVFKFSSYFQHLGFLCLQQFFCVLQFVDGGFTGQLRHQLSNVSSECVSKTLTCETCYLTLKIEILLSEDVLACFISKLQVVDEVGAFDLMLYSTVKPTLEDVVRIVRKLGSILLLFKRLQVGAYVIEFDFRARLQDICLCRMSEQSKENVCLLCV